MFTNTLSILSGSKSIFRLGELCDEIKINMNVELACSSKQSNTFLQKDIISVCIGFSFNFPWSILLKSKKLVNESQ